MPFDPDDVTRINGDDIMYDFVTELALTTAESEGGLYKSSTGEATEILVVDAGKQDGRIGQFWIRLSNGQRFILRAEEFMGESSCPAWHRLGIGPDVQWPGIAACQREQGHDGKHKDRHGNEWLTDDGTGKEIAESFKATCNHGTTVLYQGGRWFHLQDTRECKDPGFPEKAVSCRGCKGIGCQECK